MSVKVNDFLARVTQIYTESPKYVNGGYGNDGTCDCIGLIIGAIRRAGGQWRGLHGSNYAARRELVKLETITNSGALIPGEAVFKAYDPGVGGYALPARYDPGGEYYTGDLRDYYHVGVVVSASPLRIYHMTSPKAKIDTSIGKWSYHGKLKKISYSEEEIPTGQTVNYQARVIGSGALNLRREPSKESARIMQLPVGTVVAVTEETNADWRQITYNSHTGYVMAQYLDNDVTAASYIQVDRTVLEAIYDEIGNMLGLRG